MSGAGVLAVLFLVARVSSEIVVTRRHPVDSFSIKGQCRDGGCIGASMGTALGISSDGCTCACAPHLPAFREDLHICVDDLHDCPLIPFVSGTTYQKIPYVFLPLKGQIVYPSAELVFAGVDSPICVVSSAKFLSSSGWDELRNRSDTEPPFRLFRDEGRTFLQWLGDGDLRLNMEGRLILVHLMCKDMVDERNPDNNIFTPCVSFRVAGTPNEVNPKTGVKEVTFSVDAQHSSQNYGSSYIVIAVSSVLLGLIYIVSVLLYLHSKKKKKKYHENNNGPLTVAEEGIVKNNPLLKHVHDNIAYLSDPPSGSDSEDGIELTAVPDDTRTHKVQTTSALVHPYSNEKEKKHHEISYQLQESSNMERLPEENVSIVETLDYREDRPETVRAMACTNGRRKLYFNPAYFEPELLLAPPPAAIEFLTKIREVISIAKAKMEAKRFLPSLMGIPEENDYAIHKTPSVAGTESTVILRTDYNRHKHSRAEHQKHDRNVEQGCHMCCKNIEQKQTSIQRWLESVPIARVEDETSSTSSSKKNKKQFSFTSNTNVTSKNKDDGKIQNNNTLYENNEITNENEKIKPNNFISNVISGSINGENPSENKRVTVSQSNKTKVKGKVEPVLQPIQLKKDLTTTNLLNKLQDKSYLNIEKSDSDFVISKLKSIDIHKNTKEIKPSIGNPENNKWKEECNEDDSSVLANNNGFITHKNCIDNKAKLMNKLNNAKTSKQSDTGVKFSKNVYENRDDHDYETIMLGLKHEDTQSLPDFINRPNGYSLVSEVYVNDGYDYISESSHSNLSSLNSNGSDDEVEYDRNSQGHLTIKVKDNPPLNYSNDSDSFEPDTLDRKPNKLKINQEININIEKNQDIYADSLERPPHIMLKSSGTFKNDTPWNNIGTQNGTKHPLNRAFGSLREIFEAKTKYNQCSHNKSIKSSSPVGSTKSLTNDGEIYMAKSWRRGKPKLLRPEARQAKRQRDPSPPNHLTMKPPNGSHSEDPAKANLRKKEGGPPLPPRLVKPPLPPKNGAARSNNHGLVLNHELSTQSSSITTKTCKFVDIASESSEYEPLSSQEYTCYRLHTETTVLNTDQEEKNNQNKKKITKHLQNRTEDSGYLSTDSNGSDAILKMDDSVSETDDSFFDGASESGAESIATDSFFFGKGIKSNSPTDFEIASTHLHNES